MAIASEDFELEVDDFRLLGFGARAWLGGLPEWVGADGPAEAVLVEEIPGLG